SATTSVQFGREMNFIVGGNILGRGLTIENLLVTYYLRRAKVSQMDTVLQHARMYGYRKKLMPFTRVFLPEDLALKFHHIHNAEQSLRHQLSMHPPNSPLAVQTLQSLRATRLNVLDTGSLGSFGPGDQVYPARVGLDNARFGRIQELLLKAYGGALDNEGFLSVPISTLQELIKIAPYDNENSAGWQPVVLLQLLDALASTCNGQGYLHYRTMNRSKNSFTSRSGALAGDKLREARALGRPVLCMFKTTFKEDPLRTEYWYPTLVLPETMPNQVFNISV
ncbi:MAG TPA: Z1 domain-containing protein, partial [Terriglobales bacterium]